MIPENPCQHIPGISAIKAPEHYRCEECIRTGSRWVHLRTCQECGVTLCCDSSPNRHATLHFEQTGHPVTASAEPGERWLWCYTDKRFVPF